MARKNDQETVEQPPEQPPQQPLEQAKLGVFDPRSLRQRAALAVLAAFVTRHGGLGQEVERLANTRMIWLLADAFVETELADPEPPAEAPAERPRRKAHPADEFAVRDGDRQRRGFATFEEAEFYASARVGARVVQVAGPGVELGHLVADPSAE